MKYNIFTLYPQIFRSFWETSLVARGIQKGIINKQEIDWREEFGIGNYNQVDDKPYGGGSGMVLMTSPIYKAMKTNQALGGFSRNGFEKIVKNLDNKNNNQAHNPEIKPNNPYFLDYWKQYKPKSVTISMTPKGYRFNQKIAEFMAAEFDTVNILCGRFEGFDARISKHIDLELSIGDYVLNGGEVASMSVIESISRLVDGFITKNTSALHDSFSSGLNTYPEQKEFVIGKNRLKQIHQSNSNQESELRNKDYSNLFNQQDYLDNIQPYLEHPQYTRPLEFDRQEVPEVLLSGNHKKIQQFRQDWYKKTVEKSKK